jgi:hypothetical protein
MRPDRRCFRVLLCVLLVALAPIAASADEKKADEEKKPLTILSPVTFKKGVTVRDAVKAECDLLTKLPAYIKNFAEKNAEVTLAESLDKSKGRTLRVEIEEVREAGTVGPKSMTVTGELRDGGKVIGTIRARRSSMGGPLAAFGGACGILHRCEKALGKDLAGWIEKPAMNVEMNN